MTRYEVIITREEPEDAFIIDGREALLASIHFLDAAAKRGELNGCDAVYVYAELDVPGPLLMELLIHLGSQADWVDPGRVYPVYLCEI